MKAPGEWIIEHWTPSAIKWRWRSFIGGPEHEDEWTANKRFVYEVDRLDMMTEVENRPERSLRTGDHLLIRGYRWIVLDPTPEPTRGVVALSATRWHFLWGWLRHWPKKWIRLHLYWWFMRWLCRHRLLVVTEGSKISWRDFFALRDRQISLLTHKIDRTQSFITQYRELESRSPRTPMTIYAPGAIDTKITLQGFEFYYGQDRALTEEEAQRLAVFDWLARRVDEMREYGKQAT